MSKRKGSKGSKKSKPKMCSSQNTQSGKKRTRTTKSVAKVSSSSKSLNAEEHLKKTSSQDPIQKEVSQRKIEERDDIFPADLMLVSTSKSRKISLLDTNTQEFTDCFDETQP